MTARIIVTARSEGGAKVEAVDSDGTETVVELDAGEQRTLRADPYERGAAYGPIEVDISLDDDKPEKVTT